MYMREWTGKQDEKTCPLCSPIIGDRVPLGEKFKGGIEGPPLHPNCRCKTKIVEDTNTVYDPNR